MDSHADKIRKCVACVWNTLVGKSCLFLQVVWFCKYTRYFFLHIQNTGVSHVTYNTSVKL